MKIVVCTKETPDTAAKVEVVDGQVAWGDSPLIINPWDEYAVEEAILLKDRGASATTVVGMGNESTKEALKHALAMGADDAVLVSDAALADADSLATSRVLASAIEKLGDAKLVIMGKETADGNSGVVPSMVGRQLGWNTLTYVFKVVEIDFDGGTIKVERLIEDGKQVVTSQLPAVISVVKDINEPRYPSFMGIRKASRAEIPTWGLADLGIEAPAAAVKWSDIAGVPETAGQTELIEADSPEAAAKLLVEKLFEEGVV